jgi:hypothetical protein
MSWDWWVNSYENPSTDQLDFQTPNITAAYDLAQKFITDPSKVTSDDETLYVGWSSTVKTIFCIQLTNGMNNGQVEQDAGLNILLDVDAKLNISDTKNPEVKQIWFPLSISFGYEHVQEPATQWVKSQGRLKYIKPVYKAWVDKGG